MNATESVHTSIRFVGGWPLWAGLGLSIALGLLALFFYRRDLASNPISKHRMETVGRNILMGVRRVFWLLVSRITVRVGSTNSKKNIGSKEIPFDEGFEFLLN